jgi:hypothetical protein
VEGDMFKKKSRLDGLVDLTVDYWCSFADYYPNICEEMRAKVGELSGEPLLWGRGCVDEILHYRDGRRFLQLKGLSEPAADGLIEFLQQKLAESNGVIESEIARIQASMKFESDIAH